MCSTATVRFSESVYYIEEENSYVELTAYLSFSLPDALAIQVITQDGSARGDPNEPPDFEGSGVEEDHGKKMEI